MKKNKSLGLIMAWVGFLLLLFNAVGYYAKFNFGHPIIIVIGLVIAIFGVKILKTK
ncbi:MAG: hypothetical protein WBH44_05550 [Proteocatella sp.]